VAAWRSFRECEEQSFAQSFLRGQTRIGDGSLRAGRPYSLHSGPFRVITSAENGVFHLKKIRMSQRRFRSWGTLPSAILTCERFPRRHYREMRVRPAKLRTLLQPARHWRSSIERCQNDHHDDPGAKALELGKACCVLKSTETALRFYLSSLRPTEFAHWQFRKNHLLSNCEAALPYRASG
jgi:hypothetical protein